MSIVLKLDRRRRTRWIEGLDPDLVPGSTAAIASAPDIHASSFIFSSSPGAGVLRLRLARFPSESLDSPSDGIVGTAVVILSDVPTNVRLVGIRVGRRERETPEATIDGVIFPDEGNAGGDPGRENLRDGIFEGVGREVRCDCWGWVPERNLIETGSSLARRVNCEGAVCVLPA